MGQSVSLFPNYTQRENLATNYVLLIFRQIYQYSPLLLTTFLDDFLGEGVADELGLRFEQQTKKNSSIPDGLLLQAPFAMYIETKTFDWFYSSQIQKHLSSLNEENKGKKIFLALSGKDIDETKFSKIAEECESIYENKILFFAKTFQQLIDSLKKLNSNLPLLEVISEFESFCRRESLLSNWRGWIDVVNATKSISKTVEQGAYFCPAEGGAYKHERCEFLGLYDNKSIKFIGNFIGVVDVNEELIASLVWSNSSNLENLTLQAINLYKKFNRTKATRILIVDRFIATDHKKISKGGMQQHKRYFKHIEITGKPLEEISEILSKKSWE